MYSVFLAGTTAALCVGQALAGVAWGGVNIAGFDFGCDILGRCDGSKVDPPLHQFGGQDGAKQMQHFVKDDGFNVFRLPVGWQVLVSTPGGDLAGDNVDKYDALVKACLDTGAYCIIDIHNYARWDGSIIGQGGPSNEDFANLWSQLAAKYKGSPNVVMGIVNEPHDIPDIKLWAQTCQVVVDAIRKAGATQQYITLPGTGYTSAGSLVSSGSAEALATVKDLDGTTDKLIFEVHKYLDFDNSGTHTDCSDQTSALEDLTNWLVKNQRKALLAETGGGSSSGSCLDNVCKLLEYLNKNSDVYLGYLGWSAGSFDNTYPLSLTPTPKDGTKDVPLMKQCFAGQFSGRSAGGPSGGGDDGGGSGTPSPSQTAGGSNGGNGGMPMPTGGLPGGQGGTATSGQSGSQEGGQGGSGNSRPTTFATMTRGGFNTVPTDNSGAALWGSKKVIPNGGEQDEDEDDGEDCEADEL